MASHVTRINVKDQDSRLQMLHCSSNFQYQEIFTLKHRSCLTKEFEKLDTYFIEKHGKIGLDFTCDIVTCSVDRQH